MITTILCAIGAVILMKLYPMDSAVKEAPWHVGWYYDVIAFAAAFALCFLIFGIIVMETQGIEVLNQDVDNLERFLDSIVRYVEGK